MIVDERMITFINSLDHGLTPFLEELRETAAEDNVPIIRREMQSFLKVFLRIQRPQRILEVGTAIGFSTILMAACGPESSRITTIENYEKRIPVARENFQKSGYEDRITLLEGDAADVLKTLAGPYDFIFMDAAKGQYIHFLPDILDLMPIGGLPEKLMAAVRAGIRTVFIPQENVEDLEEVAEEVKEKLNIIPVHKVQEVLKQTGIK